jgi:hypothetical protein
MIRFKHSLYFVLLLVCFAPIVRAEDKWLRVKTENFTVIGNAGAKSIEQTVSHKLRADQLRLVENVSPIRDLDHHCQSRLRQCARWRLASH